MSELKEEKVELARVTAGLTYKQSRPDNHYDNLTFHISISDNQRKGEKVSEAVDRVYSWVEKKLDEKMTEQAEADNANSN